MRWSVIYYGDNEQSRQIEPTEGVVAAVRAGLADRFIASRAPLWDEAVQQAGLLLLLLLRAASSKQVYTLLAFGFDGGGHRNGVGTLGRGWLHFCEVL